MIQDLTSHSNFMQIFGIPGLTSVSVGGFLVAAVSDANRSNMERIGGAEGHEARRWAGLGGGWTVAVSRRSGHVEVRSQVALHGAAELLTGLLLQWYRPDATINSRDGRLSPVISTHDVFVDNHNG